MTKYILQVNIFRNGNSLDAIARKFDLCEILGTDGHSCSCRRLVDNSTFVTDMANLKAEISDDFLSHELDLK